MERATAFELRQAQKHEKTFELKVGPSGADLGGGGHRDKPSPPDPKQTRLRSLCDTGTKMFVRFARLKCAPLTKIDPPDAPPGGGA